jgi:hypothetical protein
MQGPRHLPSDSRRLPLSRLTHLALSLALLVSTCGCRTAQVVTADTHGAPQYQQLRLVYDLVEPALRQSGGTAPLDLEYAKSRPVQAYLISRGSSPDTFKERPFLRLSIEYPCERLEGDRALVTLAEPAGTEQWQAVAETALSRKELDVLFVHLVNGGLCESETHLRGGTRIAIEVDGTAMEKPWNREPRLDRLAVETYDARR